MTKSREQAGKIVSIGGKSFANFLIKTLFFVILTVSAVKIILPIRLAIDEPGDVPVNTNLETDVDWTNPPCNPDELSKEWREITDSRMAQNSNRRIFQYNDTKWKVAFEKGEPNSKGYRSKDHWHRYNPFSVNDKDLYLDKKDNPVGKNSEPSHILSNCK